MLRDLAAMSHLDSGVRVTAFGLAVRYTWSERARKEVNLATLTDRIEINPRVMLGKPVIRGTRVTVELILRKLSEGATEADLLEAYPRLTRKDLQAAIGYAADTVSHEETVLVGRRRRTKR